MSISITRADLSTETFTKFREETPDRVVYHAAGHTFALRDMLTVSRSLPSGNSFPTSRYNVKRTKDVTMADGSVRPKVVELSLSAPAGEEVGADALIEDLSLIRDEIQALITSLGLPA